MEGSLEEAKQLFGRLLFNDPVFILNHLIFLSYILLQKILYQLVIMFKESVGETKSPNLP